MAISRMVQQLRGHILTLEKENVALKEENAALKRRLEFARGVQLEELIAELTGGVRTKYKDSHDVTTKNGKRLEVKYSKVHTTRPSMTKRWTWSGILGLNETKVFDFLVLAGLKDPCNEKHYPALPFCGTILPYVFFLVPRNAVNDVKGYPKGVVLNTNLNKPGVPKAEMLKGYLVRSLQEFEQFTSPENGIS